MIGLERGQREDMRYKGLQEEEGGYETPIPERSPGAMQSGSVLQQALGSPLCLRQQDAASCLLAVLLHHASAVWKLTAPSEHYNSVVNTKLCSNT